MNTKQEVIIDTTIVPKLKSGYLWIFSNQILNFKQLHKKICCVDIFDEKKNFIATGVYNPHSLIAVRILSYNKDEIFDTQFFINRINRALEFRKKLNFDINYCRIVYSESDFLPGVIIDRYGNNLVLQFYSYAMELFLEKIIQALIKIFNPENIILRNDIAARENENAPQEKKLLYSTKNSNVNDVGYTLITHLGKKFLVDIVNGQKTGFFYDQKYNREYVSKIVENKDVLDLCCYNGSFSIISKYNNAKKVIGVDTSENAISLAKESAKLNNLNINFLREEIEKFLTNTKEKFDIILFDPPSYCKSKKDKIKSIKKYIALCTKILSLLNPNGILCFSVCSYHISWEDTKQIIITSLAKSEKNGYILKYGLQSLDHPIYPKMLETEYLKFIAILVN